ncbi:MAG: DNA-3-methyladenine glycosylase 2 family protein, partial [bacterium]
AKAIEIAPLEVQPNPFRSLVRAVVFQQLNGKVAEAIHTRFQSLFDGDEYPTPAQVAEVSVEAMREKGLSRPKASYIIDLANKVQDGTLQLDTLDEMTDDEVRVAITQVKGFGVWSADMFLMFTLHRPDVWPTFDLGIRNAYGKLAGMEASPKPKDLESLGDCYRPYRTLASILLWRSLDPSIQLVS